MLIYGNYRINVIKKMIIYPLLKIRIRLRLVKNIEYQSYTMIGFFIIENKECVTNEGRERIRFCCCFLCVLGRHLEYIH